MNNISRLKTANNIKTKYGRLSIPPDTFPRGRHSLPAKLPAVARCQVSPLVSATAS